MIQKVAKKSVFSKFRTGFKVVIVAEIAAFLCSYGVWYRMNRDQGNCEIHEFFVWNSDHLFNVA